MAASTPPVQIPETALRQLRDWLAQFERSWYDGALAEWVKVLPPAGDPLRPVALLGLARIDLRSQWQRGRQAPVETYLRTYPELGTADTVAVELILEECEARRQAGSPATWAELERRFPVQAVQIRHRVGQTQLTAGVVSGPEAGTPRPFPSTHPSQAGPGSVLLPEQFGRYRIVKKLGGGGMGAVYLAHDTQLDRPVALKVPFFSSEDGPEVIERFRREARATATLQHPGICPVYDVGAIDGVHYLTMAFIDGKPLTAHLNGKPLPPRNAAAVVRKIAQALAEAHAKGVIHRDLKPSNVMINARNEPVIVDFGLGRRAGDPRLTRSNAIMGTPAYMSPEQANGQVELQGPATDVYALGVILYELLTGRLPFEGPGTAILIQIVTQEPERPSVLVPGLDPRLESLCLQAMAKDSVSRPTAPALAAALGEFLRGTAPPAPPPAEVIPTVVPVEPVVQVVPAPRPRTVPPVATVDTAPMVEVKRSARGNKARRSAGRPRPQRSYAGVVVLLFLVLGAAGGGVAAYLLWPSSDAYQRGLDHAGRREYDKAVEAFTEALGRAPNRADAYRARADAHFKSGGYDKAIDDCAEALRLEPRNAWANACRGGAYNRVGDFDKAIADCTEAIRLDPNIALAYAHRGDAYGNQADCDKALADLDKAIRLDPNLALAYAHRADAYGDLGDYDKAIADCDEAIRFDPFLGLAYAYRGSVYARQGEWLKSQADFDEAIRLAPREAEVFNARGVANVEKGEHDQALADYDKAIRLAPRFAEFYCNRATEYRNRGEVQKAMDDLDEALRISPRSAIAHVVRAEVYFRDKNDLEQALAECGRALSLNPKLFSAHTLRAQVYQARGDFPKALDSYRDALTLNPKAAWAHAERGAIFQVQQRFDEAILEYNAAIGLDLDNLPAHVGRSWCRIQKRDYDGAVADATRTLEIDPDNPGALFNRAFAHVEARRWDQGIADYTRVVELQPNNAVAYSNRGVARHGRGDYRLAIDDYTAAIERDRTYVPAYRGRSASYKALGEDARSRADDEKAAALEGNKPAPPPPAKGKGGE